MSMTEELVNRKYLIDEITKAQTSLETDNSAMWEINQKYHKGLSWAHRIVIDAPAVEAREVVHGKWELHGNDDNCGCSFFCSRCGFNFDEDAIYNDDGTRKRELPNFCECCGAKMDGE
jgi:hypothetical protein